jgi:hypothetical protein
VADRPDRRPRPLIGGRDSLSKIGAEAKVWVVALAAVALVANLAAIGLATMSNVGLPKMARISGPEALINADLTPLRQTRRAIDYLRWAIFTAALAFFATIASVIVLWLAPDANPAPTTVDVTVTSGTTSTIVCGTLAADQPPDGNHLALIRTDPAETDIYSLSSISRIAPGDC